MSVCYNHVITIRRLAMYQIKNAMNIPDIISVKVKEAAENVEIIATAARNITDPETYKDHKREILEQVAKFRTAMSQAQEIVLAIALAMEEAVEEWKVRHVEPATRYFTFDEAQECTEVDKAAYDAVTVPDAEDIPAPEGIPF